MTLAVFKSRADTEMICFNDVELAYHVQNYYGNDFSLKLYSDSFNPLPWTQIISEIILDCNHCSVIANSDVTLEKKYFSYMNSGIRNSEILLYWGRVYQYHFQAIVNRIVWFKWSNCFWFLGFANKMRRKFVLIYETHFLLQVCYRTSSSTVFMLILQWKSQSYIFKIQIPNLDMQKKVFAKEQLCKKVV